MLKIMLHIVGWHKGNNRICYVVHTIITSNIIIIIYCDIHATHTYYIYFMYTPKKDTSPSLSSIFYLGCALLSFVLRPNIFIKIDPTHPTTEPPSPFLIYRVPLLLAKFIYY